MKKLLIIVDYQNDFVIGSLANNNAKKIEDHIEKLIKSAIKNKEEIVFLMDAHQKDYLKTIEGKNLPILHTIENTEGWKIYGKIANYASKAKTFKKNTFGSTQLFNFLKNKKYKEIQLCGLLTNMCVLVNACICKTVCPNTPIIIDRKSVASNDAKLEQAAFNILSNLHIKIK